MVGEVPSYRQPLGLSLWAAPQGAFQDPNCRAARGPGGWSMGPGPVSAPLRPKVAPQRNWGEHNLNQRHGVKGRTRRHEGASQQRGLSAKPSTFIPDSGLSEPRVRRTLPALPQQRMGKGPRPNTPATTLSISRQGTALRPQQWPQGKKAWPRPVEIQLFENELNL